MAEDRMKRNTSPRILMVDDEQVNLRVMRTVLERAGYNNLVTVDDPRTVIAEHRREPADLVLLDLSMPGFDGYAVMKQLSGERERPAPAIIVITGHTDQDKIDRAVDAGADAYVAKPIDLEEFLTTVAAVLEERG